MVIYRGAVLKGGGFYFREGSLFERSEGERLDPLGGLSEMMRLVDPCKGAGRRESQGETMENRGKANGRLNQREPTEEKEDQWESSRGNQ